MNERLKEYQKLFDNIGHMHMFIGPDLQSQGLL